MTTKDTQTLESLQAAHAAERARIIAMDGGIDPFGVYPELDRLSGLFWDIITQGTGKLTLSAETIKALAK